MSLYLMIALALPLEPPWLETSGVEVRHLYTLDEVVARIREAKDDTWRFRTEAVLAIDDSQRLRYAVVTFHRPWVEMSDGVRRPFWMARWTTSRYDGEARHAIVERYADARECPALLEVLAEVEDLPAPRPDLASRSIPDPTAPTQLRHVPVGYSVTFETSGAWFPDGSMTTYTVTSDSQSPLARWAIDAETALADCWRLEPPADLRLDEE